MLDKAYLAVSSLITILFTGCTFVPIQVPVNVYNLESGETLSASFRFDGSGKGSISMTRPNGIQCTGEYLTQIGGHSSAGRSRSWGTIYTWGAGYNTTNSSYSTATTLPNTQLGSAILVCPDKNVIECEYVVNRQTNNGSGFCRDKQNTKYKFLF